MTDNVVTFKCTECMHQFTQMPVCPECDREITLANCEAAFSFVEYAYEEHKYDDLGHHSGTARLKLQWLHYVLLRRCLQELVKLKKKDTPND